MVVLPTTILMGYGLVVGRYKDGRFQDGSLVSINSWFWRENKLLRVTLFSPTTTYALSW